MGITLTPPTATRCRLTRAAAQLSLIATAACATPALADTDGYHYRQGVVAAARGDHQALIEHLEAIDLTTTPLTPYADRAAFLLASAYRDAGDQTRLSDLAERVLLWPIDSVYTRWVVHHYLLGVSTRSEDRLLESAARWRAHRARNAPANGDSAIGTTSDALAANLLLRGGYAGAAHRLVARLKAEGPSAPLVSFVKSVTASANGRDDDAMLRSLARTDTTTALGRDLAAAARIRLAGEGLSRGESPIPILSFVSARSRYASRADHIIGVHLIERGEMARGIAHLRRALERDPDYPDRRRLLLAVAGNALERRDVIEAMTLYDAVEESWLDEQRTLETLLTEAPVDSLWNAWRRSSPASDVLVFDTVPAERLVERIAAETLLDLTSSPPERGEGLDYKPPRSPGPRDTSWPPPSRTRAPSLGRPTLAEQLDIEDGAAVLRAAGNELERLGWALDRERRRMEGPGRTDGERLGDRERALSAVLDGLEHLARDLAGVHDAAFRRIGRRTSGMLERARTRLLAIAPAGEAASAAEIFEAEERLASELLAFADAFAAGAAELALRAHDDDPNPWISKKATRLTRLVHEHLEWARRVEGEVDLSSSAPGSARIASLEAEIAELRSHHDALAAEHEARREAVAHVVVRRAFESMESEREAVDYGLATMAYVRAVATGKELGELAGDRLALREAALSRLTRFLAEHPETPARSEIRFHIADLELLAAKERFQQEMLAFENARERGDRPGAVPQVGYRPALERYLAILAEDPEYPHRDAVLFNAGMILADEGRTARAERLLEDLVHTYPRSPFVQEANLRIGDIRFDDRRYGHCVPAYEQASVGDDPSLAAIALYKLGWSEFSRDRFLSAADSFRRLIDLYDAGSAIQLESDLRPEAIDYLIHSLVRAGGAGAFDSYFSEVGERTYQREVLAAMGQLLRRYSLLAEAIEVDRLWVRTFPTDPDLLVTVERMVSTLDRWEKPGDARELRLELAPAFVPGSEWYEANPTDSLRAAGRLFTRRSWEIVAIHHHEEARAGRNARENLEVALDLYSTLQLTWPEAADRLELRSGEAAYELGDHARAIGHYARAATSDSTTLARSARRQSVTVTDAWYEAERRAAKPRGDGSHLGPDSLAVRVVSTIDDYLALHPDDRRANDLVWRKANLAYAHGWNERASKELSGFVDRYPDDRRTPRAASLAADALHTEGAYSEAAAAYERALAIATAAGADSLAARILAALPVCRFRHAEAVAAEAASSPGELALLNESIARRWPTFEHAALCQYRAALAHLESGDPRRAILAYEDLIARFPDSEYVKDAHLGIIQTAEREGLRERAAASYVRFADAFPSDANAGDALLAAASHLDALRRPEDAEMLRLRFVDAHPEDVATSLAILSQLARRDLERVTSGVVSIDAVFPPRGSSREQSARSFLERYLDLASEHEDLAVAAIAAEALFRRAEATRPSFEAAALTQPLERAIETKNEHLEVLLGAFRACAEAGVSEFSHASAYRIGEALVGFGRALESSERPVDLDGDDLLAYEDVLYEQAWTFYDRGEGVWTDLLRASAGEDDGSGWLSRARTSLWARLGKRFLHRPEFEYPLVQATPPPSRLPPAAEAEQAPPDGARSLPPRGRSLATAGPRGALR